MNGSTRRRSWWLTAVLSLTVAVLIALNWQIYDHEIDVSAIVPTEPKPRVALKEAAEPDVLFPEISSDKPTETLKRPLFRPDRRPYVPKAAAVSAAPSQPPVPPPALPPGLVLVGIVSTSEGHRAVIRTDGVVGVQNYAEGAMLGGWALTSIQMNEVVLTANGETRKLQLFSDLQSRQGPGSVRSSADLSLVPNP
jgi:hypothetical protein